MGAALYVPSEAAGQRRQSEAWLRVSQNSIEPSLIGLMDDVIYDAGCSCYQSR